jgi:hypothetical protein
MIPVSIVFPTPTSSAINSLSSEPGEINLLRGLN